jgi:gliding motility-associated-like protein
VTANKNTGLVGLLLWLISIISIAQPGIVIESGDQVLDPNQDGYISIDANGFSGDGYDPDEFEIKMFGVPIFGDGEVLKDIQAGEPCGVSDLALDTAGYALYAGYDNNQNLIFRFRLAGDKPSVQSYSVLIDTDQLIGSEDPNAQGINPGFEIEITLIHNFGVYIYEIDGTESCPVPTVAYSVDTHQQKSYSSRLSCGDPDIFIDFYVPFSDLENIFGITPSTNLRFAGVTNISATCVLDGKISDIGGVDDTPYDGCFTCAMLDLTENQCPASVDMLCETCGGFPLGATQTPTINLPVLVGDTQISGTAEPEAAIFIAVYNVAGTLLDQDTIASDLVGDWQSTMFVSPLNFEDSITVNALLPGKCESGLSDTGLSFAIVSPNQPPQLLGSNLTITYIENDPPVVVADSIVIQDDNADMVSASVWVAANFQTGADILEAVPPPGIAVDNLLSEGRLNFSGSASMEDYMIALRSVTFYNNSENPDLSVRTLSIIVNDGFNSSSVFNKELIITAKNDPPVITINNNPVDTIYMSTLEDVPMEICIAAQDLDLDNLKITNFAITDGNGTIEQHSDLCLLFSPQANFNGQVFATITVCDDGDPSLCDEVVVAIEVIPVNDPPVILVNGLPTDSLNYITRKNTPLEFCLAGFDIENDQIHVESATITTNTSSEITYGPDLCFLYTPEQDFGEEDRIEILICDNGDPSRCTLIYVGVKLRSNNLPPVIMADTIYVDVPMNTSRSICVDVTDPDGDSLAFSGISELLNVGAAVTPDFPCLSYSPPANFFGLDMLKVIICDNFNPALCDSVVIKLNVFPVNNPPEVFQNNIPVDTVRLSTLINTPLTACLNVVDPENDNVVISAAAITSGTGSISINNDICVDFLPGLDFTGTVWASATICDDGSPVQCVDIVLEVEVLPVNQPPVIEANGSSVDTLYFQTEKNNELEFCITAQDPEDDVLNIEGINEINGAGFYIPGNGNLCVVFVPTPDLVGTDLHLITICDGGSPLGCDSVYVEIEILPVNNPPQLLWQGQAVDTILVTTPENVPIDICIASRDQDGDEVLFSDLLLIAGEGVVSNSQPGTDFCVNYNPALNFFGITWVSLRVCDNGVPQLCDEVVIGIDVLNVNQKPEILFNGQLADTLFFSTPGRTPIDICVDAVDKDGDELSLDLDNIGSANATLIAGQDPLCFQYQPANDYLGNDLFSVVVCDDGEPSLCDTVIALVNVYSDNTAPEIYYAGKPVDTLVLSITEMEEIALDFSVIDAENDDIMLGPSQLLAGAGQLEVVMTSDIILAYTPDVLSAGKHEILLEVCDNGLPSLCANLLLIVDVDPQGLLPYQALSPNGDGLNDFWQIQGIEHYPNNQVRIFDRWNNMVYSIDGYNNNDVVWTGQSNRGITKKNLEDGTYYYKLKPGPGRATLSGMIILKR